MDRKAFSLIELLSVIVILGIIASVGYFVSNRVSHTSKQNAMLLMANDIRMGVIDHMIVDKDPNPPRYVDLIPLDNNYQDINFKENDPWGKPYNKLYAEVEKNNFSLKIDVFMEVSGKGCYVSFENNDILFRQGDTCTQSP